MSRIIGIDLGTSNSCVAILRDGQPLVLPNSEGARTTPSIVAIVEDGTMLIGHQAKRQSVINPQRTVFGVKRLIGRRFRSREAQDLAQVIPYQLSEALNGDVWIEIGEHQYSPQEISAAILSKMKSTAEDYFGEPVTEAVITVPAYFDDAQRQATRDAGKIAGLDIRRILNEPTAAALAYGFNKKQDSTIAVFDLGGGTFDISVLRVKDGIFEVIATAGNNALGGDDFDRVIVRELLARFEQEHGVDLSDDAVALQRLREAAETAKCELSSLSETNINLPFLAANDAGPMHLTFVLGREDLNELCLDLVDALAEPCEIALEDAGLTAADLNEVLIVGGMTRMPLVQERVKEMFGMTPRKGVNPDEVVAAGAAVQSGILGGEVREVVLMDVTPLSLGIRVINSKMSTVITRNTSIPATSTKQFITTENEQTFVSIVILQGESADASENRVLGTFRLDGLEPKPAGEVRIDVEFTIDVNGLVTVAACDADTGVATSVSVTNNSGLTEEDIARASSRSNIGAA
ncbi:MAG: molecular chaperone DnaK [Flavobacteriales bacterium]|jgi:molecular chaperone DnaK